MLIKFESSIEVAFFSAMKEMGESLALFKNPVWVVLPWMLLHLEHCSWEPSWSSLRGSEMHFPVQRALSNIKKCVFFCFDASSGLLPRFITNLLFTWLWCEVEMLLWAEQCCLLPSWLQFLQIEFCWIPSSGMKGAQDCSNTRVVAVCQVLLTSQPSWRLESDKPVTREDNWFTKAPLAPPEHHW